jgi:hypothetical protein
MPTDNTIALSRIKYTPEPQVLDSIEVQVFSWLNSEWVLKGNQINTSAFEGYYHSSYLEMPNENNLLLKTSNTNLYSGWSMIPDTTDILVYNWDGFNWNENIGVYLNDKGYYSASFPDSNTFAIGSSGNSTNGLGAGRVQVFSICNYSTSGVLGNIVPNSYSGENYSCEALPGNSYNWDVTNGVILSGQGTSNVNILWGAGGIGSISVTETTLQGCVGELIHLQVNIQCSTTSNSIFGPLGPSAFSTQTYSSNGATGSVYNWSVSNGVILSGQGTNSIEVLWADQGMGSLSVYEITSDGCVGDTIIQNVVVIPTSVEELDLGSIYYYDNAIRFSEASSEIGKQYLVYDLHLYTRNT